MATPGSQQWGRWGHFLGHVAMAPTILTETMWKFYNWNRWSFFSSIKFHNKYYIQCIKVTMPTFFYVIRKLHCFCASIWTGAGTFYFEEPDNNICKVFRPEGLCHSDSLHVFLAQKHSWARWKRMGVAVFQAILCMKYIVLGPPLIDLLHRREVLQCKMRKILLSFIKKVLRGTLC